MYVYKLTATVTGTVVVTSVETKPKPKSNQRGVGARASPVAARAMAEPVAMEAASATCSKAFALTWYRALTWYCSPARPFAALDVPLLVTGQQGGPSPACRQLSRARNTCAGSSSEESTKLKHGTKLGRTLAMGACRYIYIHMEPVAMAAASATYTKRKTRVNPNPLTP